jgi:hypothetical protein
MYNSVNGCITATNSDYILFLVLTVHELSHSVAAKSTGSSAITLFQMTLIVVYFPLDCLHYTAHPLTYQLVPTTLITGGSVRFVSFDSSEFVMWISFINILHTTATRNVTINSNENFHMCQFHTRKQFTNK